MYSILFLLKGSMDTIFWLMRSFVWVYLAIKNSGNDMNHYHSLELSAVISLLLSFISVLAIFLLFVELSTMTIVTFLLFSFVLYHSTGVVFYVLNVKPEVNECKSKWQNSGPW